MSTPAHTGRSECPFRLRSDGTGFHEEVSYLRERGPAVRVELPGGVVAWGITRHDLVTRLLTDPRLSRDGRAHWPEYDTVGDDRPPAQLMFLEAFVNREGEEHQRLRRLVAPAFTSARVRRMEKTIRERARALVADLARTAPGESADARAALARPLTSGVVCELFGVPGPLRDRLTHLVEANIDTTTGAEEVLARRRELMACLNELVEHQSRAPGENLTGDLVAPESGEPLPREELLATLTLMIGAGFETAVNLVSNAIHALLVHPRYRDRLVEGELSAEAVVEESLRLDPPAKYVPLRYAVEDVYLGEGVTIPRGDPVLIALGAPGRDPELHPEAPDAFDPDRASKEHVAFGHGAHFCVGAHLARTEARVALEELFAALPRLTPADQGRNPEPVPSILINGPAELPVVPHPTEGGGVDLPAANR